MAPPKLLDDLNNYVEETQTLYTDPAERDRALGVLETGLTTVLGKVRTYRNNAQLQTEGDGSGSDDDGTTGDAAKAAPPPTAEPS